MFYTKPLTRFPQAALALLMAMVLLLLSGCASSKPAFPETQLTVSESAVEQAKQVGAQEYAPVILRDAQKKLEAAQKAAEDGDTAKAKRLAEQARVDAELAEVMALSSKAQEAVTALKESIKALRDEINRNASGN